LFVDWDLNLYKEIGLQVTFLGNDFKKKEPYKINNKITNYNNSIIKSIKNNTSKNENKHIKFILRCKN